MSTILEGLLENQNIMALCSSFVLLAQGVDTGFFTKLHLLTCRLNEFKVSYVALHPVPLYSHN